MVISKTKRLKNTIALLCALILMVGNVGIVCAAQSVAGEIAKDPVKVYKVYPNGKAFHLEEMETDMAVVTSSDTNVASTLFNGTVNPGKIGTAEVNIYDIGSKERKNVLVKVAYRQDIQIPKDAYTVSYGEDAFNLGATTSGTEGNALSYESEDESIATVDEKGNVSIKGAGTTRINIKAAASTSYHEAENSVAVEVKKKAQELGLKWNTCTISTLNRDLKIESSAENASKFKYKSSDEKVVKVSEDGKLEPVSKGKAVITVKLAGDKNHEAAKDTVDVEVTKPEVNEVALYAVEWARTIAADNSFNYGTKPMSQHKGCYFCGTEKKGKGKYVKHWSAKWEKTYCCNTFCFSAYAHGGQVASMLNACAKGNNAAWGKEWTKYGFVNLGKIPYDELQIGDVLTSGNHMWMMSDPENDLLVESTGGGWGKSSIREKSGARSKYKKAYYVLRYAGN